jgi:hypothetical protein
MLPNVHNERRAPLLRAPFSIVLLGGVASVLMPRKSYFAITSSISIRSGVATPTALSTSGCG